MHRSWLQIIMLLAVLLVTTASPAYAIPFPPDAQKVEECVTVDGSKWCFYFYYSVDCTGWEIHYWGADDADFIVDAGAVADGSKSGTWENPSNQDSVEVYLIAFLPSPGIVFYETYTLAEPSECVPNSCDTTPAYYMYTFKDSNQPESWTPYCYIISNDGFPSVERQAALCSVAGFDHSFQATSTRYQGWVSVGCGSANYGWPAWQSEWYRPEFAQ